MKFELFPLIDPCFTGVRLLNADVKLSLNSLNSALFKSSPNNLFSSVLNASWTKCLVSVLNVVGLFFCNKYSKHKIVWITKQLFLVTKVNQKTNLTFIILNYHMSATFHTISKTNFRNFAKSFVEKILTLS